MIDCSLAVACIVHQRFRSRSIIVMPMDNEATQSRRLKRVYEKSLSNSMFTEQWIKSTQNESRNHFSAKNGLKRSQILFLMPKSNPAWSICSLLGGYSKDLIKIEGLYEKKRYFGMEI